MIFDRDNDSTGSAETLNVNSAWTLNKSSVMLADNLSPRGKPS